MSQSGTGAIESGAAVQVTGIVYRGFDVKGVKQETGVELDQAPYQAWKGTPTSWPPRWSPNSNAGVTFRTKVRG